MSAKRDAIERLDDIVSLAERVIVKARAAQDAMATIDEPAPPEREDDQE